VLKSTFTTVTINCSGSNQKDTERASELDTPKRRKQRFTCGYKRFWTLESPLKMSECHCIENQGSFLVSNFIMSFNQLGFWLFLVQS